jgi:hypothetical protein
MVFNILLVGYYVSNMFEDDRLPINTLFRGHSVGDHRRSLRLGGVETASYVLSGKRAPLSW